MADVLEYTANAGNVFDIQNRIISNQERMGGVFTRTGASGDHIGAGFLRSERAVSRASGNLVANLLQVNSASDAVAVTLQSIERSTHLGLGLAIGIGVATKAYEVLNAQIQKTHAAEEALDKDIAAPKSVALGLSNAGLSSESGSLQKDIEEAFKQGNSTTQNAADVLKYGPQWWTHLTGQKGTDTIDEERSNRIAAGQSRLRDIQEQIAKNAMEEADYGDRNLYTTERDVELKKAEVAAQQEINALRKSSTEGSNAGLEKHIDAIRKTEQQKEDKINLKGDLAEIDQSEEAEKSVLTGTREQKAAQALLIEYEHQAKALQIIKDLHGSSFDIQKAEIALAKTQGQVRQKARDDLQNPQALQARERAEKSADTAFDAKVQYFLDQTKRGVKFDKDDPSAKIIQDFLAHGGKDAQGKDFKGVNSLADKDFAGLSSLGDAEFPGLKALADLQITIK